MTEEKPIKCDLCVIGSGLAGMAATFFAATRDLSVAQVGHTGEIIFASGLLDLLGVHPQHHPARDRHGRGVPLTTLEG